MEIKADIAVFPGCMPGPICEALVAGADESPKVAEQPANGAALAEARGRIAAAASQYFEEYRVRVEFDVCGLCTRDAGDQANAALRICLPGDGHALRPRVAKVVAFLSTSPRGGLVFPRIPHMQPPRRGDLIIFPAMLTHPFFFQAVQTREIFFLEASIDALMS